MYRKIQVSTIPKITFHNLTSHSFFKTVNAQFHMKIPISPKPFLITKQQPKTGNHYTITHHNQLVSFIKIIGTTIQLNLIKIHQFINFPQLSTTATYSSPIHHFNDTHCINSTTTYVKITTTTFEHKFMHNSTLQLQFSSNLLKNTKHQQLCI